MLLEAQKNDSCHQYYPTILHVTDGFVGLLIFWLWRALPWRYALLLHRQARRAHTVRCRLPMIGSAHLTCRP